MKGFGPSIEIAPKVQRPFPGKEIFWGSQEGGCNRFPEKDAIWNRKHSDNPAPLLAFGRAVSGAQERVWIVDEYLLMPDRGDPKNRIEQILEWLPLWLAANDIRFLTKHHAEIDESELTQFQERAQEINNSSARRQMKCTIEARTHLTQKSCNFIHDRFAIIDDELWHFGGTVGGFQASVSAASRGWRASDHGAIDFFEMAWSAGERK